MIEIQKFATRNRLHTRIDEDLTKIILGKVGHIYEYDDNHLGVIIMPNPPRKQYWGFTKRTLIALGCEVVQDGDGEGAATFDPSNSEQVKAAIKAAGIKRIRYLSPEEKQRRTRLLSITGRKAPAARGAKKSGQTGEFIKSLVSSRKNTPACPPSGES
jgi:hypothetical protein